jgi:hypothetical protein
MLAFQESSVRKQPRDDAAADARRAVRRRTVSLARQVWELAKADARRASDMLTNSLILQKWEYPLIIGNPMMKVECRGDRLVRLINEGLAYLDVNGYERSSQQRLFHRAFMQSSYKMLYGDELHKHLVRILEENNVCELRTEVACTTPRRFGKTFSIAMWCATWLVVGADHDSSIYSTSSRVSKMLLQLIIHMAGILQVKFGGAITTVDKNEFVFYRTDAGYENSVHAYPAKSETLRGTGTKKTMGTVVLEEAAYIPPDVTTSIVAPTLTRDNVNLLAISTINSDDVTMKGFMNARYADGRSVMLCLNFSLVCAECKATGREETCKHLMGELPHWSSSAQHTKLDAMLKDAKETLQREIKGLDISENTKPAFNTQSVRVLRDDDLSVVPTPVPCPVLFCTIDPACGGAGSSFALVTCAYVASFCVVVGGEEIGSSSDTDRKNAILEHFRALRARTEFAGCTIVVCVESNLGAEAENYCNFLRERGVVNLVIMREDNERDGWRTTHETKKMGVIRMNSILNERRLKFCRNITRVSSRNPENTPQQLREHIIEQLQAYMRIVLPKKNFWDDEKEKFSGKLGGRDDLAIALQMSLLIFERFKARQRDGVYRIVA